ncbi:MAG: hypothetical protein R3Y08_07525 [Rikenellaceae bacterium]
MRRYKNILLAAVAALIMTPAALFAQSYGSINTFSPYTMYGIGELSNQGSLTTRSMGGAGVALRTPTEINYLNPASYSGMFNKSVLFSYGVEGSNYFNSQIRNGSKLSNSYAFLNIHDLAIQLPITKKMGMALVIAPYSSAGYNISTSDNFSEIGLLSYNYEGGGDITHVKLGVGWEPFKNFSVGLSAQYYWGTIARSFTMEPYVVTGFGTYYSTMGESSYTVSKIKFQTGLQWSPISSMTRNLTFGLTYDLGGDLSPEYNHTVVGNGTLLSIVATNLTETLDLVLPNQIAAGVSYRNTKWLLGADYVYQNWLTGNGNFVEYTSSDLAVAYNDFSTYKVGAQYTPRRNDVRNYFNRVSYSAGFRYGGYQNTFGGNEISQYAITAGVSFPLKMGGISKIDAGLEYGSRGDHSIVQTPTTSVGLIRQNYIKFSLAFTLFGEDYWFQRPKFD